jgi:hypothetical protein
MTKAQHPESRGSPGERQIYRLLGSSLGGTGYDDGDGGEPLALTNGGQQRDAVILRQI